MRGFGSRFRKRGASQSSKGGSARLPQRPIGRYVIALVLIGVLAVLS